MTGNRPVIAWEREGTDKGRRELWGMAELITQGKGKEVHRCEYEKQNLVSYYYLLINHCTYCY